MQRDHNNAVTALSILIPAERGEEEGFVSFRGELGIKPVRTLRNTDLKHARKVMREHEAMHFSAVIRLIQVALAGTRDGLALTKGIKMLCEAYEMKKKWAGPSVPFPPPVNPDKERTRYARAVAELMKLPPEQAEEALEIYEGLRPGPLLRSNPIQWVSFEISEAVRTAQLVLWWSGQSPRPAIWCPDLRTAFYARALLGSFRICPQCGGPFFPQRPDQNYCSVAHREAYRVARWRSRKKQQTTRKERGINSGSSKTR